MACVRNRAERAALRRLGRAGAEARGQNLHLTLHLFL